jgi:YVTN family beta-propeller protein
MGLALSRDESTLYVTTGRAGTVAAIDLARRALVRSVPTGDRARPWGIASDRGEALVVANGPSGQIAVLDAASLALRRALSVGRSPWGVACKTSR